MKLVFSSTIKDLEAEVQEYISRGFFKNKKIKQLLKKTEFLNFKTRNIVYIIFNKFSKNFYIGETSRSFEERILEHLKNIGKKEMKLNCMMEKSGNYLFYILKKCNNSVDRKRLERMLIKILNPDLNTFMKKDRKKEKLKKNIDLLKLSEFNNGKEKCYCLNYFTNQESNEGYQKIEFINGDLDISNWRTIYQNLKNKRIKLNNVEMNFSKFQKLFKKTKSGTLELWEIEKFNINEYRKELRKLELHPKEITLQEITKLWGKRKFIKDKFIRGKFKKIIYSYITWKFNVEIKNYWIKIPFSKNVNKLEIKKGIMKLFNYPKVIKRIIKSKIQVTFTKRKSIGDILLNHKKFSKNVNTILPKCCCNIIGKAKKHIIMKIEECDILTKEEKEQIRLMDIPLPHSPNNYYNIKMEIKNLIIKLTKNCNEETTNKIKKLAKQLTKNRNVEFNNKFILEKNILNIKTKLHGWIIVPLDKNTGSCALACPILYRDYLLANFKWVGKERKYIKRLQHSESILQYMKKFNQRFKSYTPKNSALPSSYILPKNKDIQRYRPIVSYFNHPCKTLFKIASRGLVHLLKHSQEKSFSIFNTLDPMKFIKEQKLVKYGKHLLLKADIKEMYTHLPHQEIIKSINWIICCYRKKIKEEIISIKSKGKIETITGEYQGKKRKQFKQLSINEIKEITLFDLENSYLWCGKFLLQQTKGIPMGSPLSPILAILYCCRIESYFLDTLKINMKFNSIRYIDDILIILSGKEKEMTERNIQQLIVTMKHFYHNGCDVVMEIEESGQNINFLENKISIFRDNLEIEYFNKNEENIENENKQKIIRFKHWKSYEPEEQKLGLIIGFLTRISRLSNDENALLHNILCLIKELYLLGYPRRIINTALYKMELKTEQKIWKLARSKSFT